MCGKLVLALELEAPVIYERMLLDTLQELYKGQMGLRIRSAAEKAEIDERWHHPLPGIPMFSRPFG